MILLKPKSFVSIGSSYFIGEDEANQLSNYLLQIRNLSEDRKETKAKLENTENTTQEMRKELQNEIKDKEKTIQNYVKTVSKLRKTIRSKDFELAGSSARQDGLLHQLDNLVKKSDLQKTSFLARLQAEREDQRKQFNSLAERSTELINEVLDQQ
jgi:prefoldin subunit 5